MLLNSASLEQKRKWKGIKYKILKEYTDFLENVINSDYAEKVPPDELGNVFYLPHHGAYHPRKGKLRVVFDCAVTYKGTSLNDELLQGPSLTSSLIGVLLRFKREAVAFVSDVKSCFWIESNTSVEINQQ